MRAYDLAPVTAALCLLARALASDNSVRRLQLNLAGFCPDFSGVAVPQISRVLSELNRTVELNTSFRCCTTILCPSSYLLYSRCNMCA